jgi:hypothetical protein
MRADLQVRALSRVWLSFHYWQNLVAWASSESVCPLSILPNNPRPRRRL